MERRLMIQNRVQRLFAKLDLNQDGLIGPFETRKAPPRMTKLLKLADKNGNGFVTKGELRLTMTQRWNSKKGQKNWGQKHKGQKNWGQKHKGQKNWNKTPKAPKPGAAKPWNKGPHGKSAPPATVHVRDHRTPKARAKPVIIRDHRTPVKQPPVKKLLKKNLTISGRLVL